MSRREGMEARWNRWQRDQGTTHARCTYCGKIEYTTRSAAKRAMKRFPGHRMNAYRCPHNTSFFHIGHLSPRIIAGQESRQDRYR